LNIVLPVAPERSLAILEWYLPETEHGKPSAQASVEFSDLIQMEDVGICEKVQRKSPFAELLAGRFSVRQEKGVHRVSLDVRGVDAEVLTTENAKRAERKAVGLEILVCLFSAALANSAVKGFPLLPASK
jgi:hypothetical protein